MFCDLLKSLRVRKGVTQIELAKAIGVSNGNVGDWERGRSKPGYDALVLLSRFFEVDAGYLLELPRPESTVLCDGIPLTDLEADLVAMFRLLDERDRRDVFDNVYGKYKRMSGDKKGSIYSTYFEENKPQESDPVSGGNSASELA